MSMRALKLVVLLVASGLLVACSSDVDSDATATSNMYAKYTAERSADARVAAVAQLLLGGADSSTFVDLAAGDRLTAEYSGTIQTMVREVDLLGAISYTADFVAPALVDNSVVITLARADGSRLPSSADLPAGFDITAPANASTFPATASVQLTWTPAAPAGVATRVAWDTECDDSSGATRLISASLPLAAGAVDFTQFASGFLPAAPTGITLVRCDVLIRVYQEVVADVNVAFGQGGEFRVAAMRPLSIVVTPAPTSTP